MSRPVCAIVGVGPGNGAAFARRFAREGYAVALIARSAELGAGLASELGHARSYACDVTDPQAVERVFGDIRDQLGSVDVLIQNAAYASPTAWGSVEEISLEAFEASWRVSGLGTLIAARQVIPSMIEKGSGNIIIIGATASRRGGAKMAAFAPAKAAQRTLAESMARQLWPKGIHVALVIIDGVVDGPRSRQFLPDKPDSFFVKPDEVAATVYALTQQPRSAWSFELEARPFGENW
jgi:NAD(P)-dependent dehydrogenase (short-subunit alcohol dehydrogenase family)